MLHLPILFCVCKLSLLSPYSYSASYILFFYLHAFLFSFEKLINSIQPQLSLLSFLSINVLHMFVLWFDLLLFFLNNLTTSAYFFCTASWHWYSSNIYSILDPKFPILVKYTNLTVFKLFFCFFCCTQPSLYNKAGKSIAI